MAQRPPYKDGPLGGTPLIAARLNAQEADLALSLRQLARIPEALFVGAVNTDGQGAPITASVQWPDGTQGNYVGQTPTIPGAVDTYTITYLGDTTLTFTQPTVTRDAAGNVMYRPAITIT